MHLTVILMQKEMAYKYQTNYYGYQMIIVGIAVESTKRLPDDIRRIRRQLPYRLLATVSDSTQTSKVYILTGEQKIDRFFYDLFFVICGISRK